MDDASDLADSAAAAFVSGMEVSDASGNEQGDLRPFDLLLRFQDMATGTSGDGRGERSEKGTNCEMPGWPPL